MKSMLPTDDLESRYLEIVACTVSRGSSATDIKPCERLVGADWNFHASRLGKHNRRGSRGAA